MHMNIVIFPNLVNALLEIRSPTAVRLDTPDGEDFTQFPAMPHDTFELTGRVARLDSHGRDCAMFLVEGELEPDDTTKYWIPLNVAKHGPDHLVCTPKGNELGPLCYSETEQRFW